MKKWIKEMIEKGFDYGDVKDLIEDKDFTEEEKKEALELFEEETAEKEKLKMGFFQRRRLRKMIKRVRKKADENAKVVEELTKNIKALNKEEKMKLEELKEQMIEAIMGNKENKQEGLADIFEITDEGKPIKRETLEEADVKEVQELLMELLDEFSKEV